jgi:endonuclease YncB( thermonuclease family)
MHRSRTTALAIAAAIAFAVPAVAGDLAPGAVLQADCAGVVDGDTLKVKTDAGTFEIDLAGIDAPEMDQEWGREVREFVRSMTRRCDLELTVVSVDGDHVVARVSSRGQDLSRLLAMRGLAWATGDGPDATELEKLADGAKQHPCGLWTGSNPVPPWEHREHAA